jgi:O-antigen ligase
MDTATNTSASLRDAPRANAHRDRAVSANDKVVLCGTLGLVLFTPLAFGAVQPWAILFVESVAAALFLIWAFGQVRIGQLDILGNPLFLPIAAFGLLVVVQIGLHRSAYGYQSQSRLVLYAAYGMVCFLIVQTLRRTRQVKILAIALSSYGGIVAFFALIQGITGNGKLYWLRTPSSGGWIYGPYVNHNHYAGLMEMLFPVALVTALSHYSRGAQKFCAALAAAFMGTTIFLSGSRGGMMAFACQLVVLAIVLLHREGARSKEAKRWIVALGMFALLLIILLAGTADRIFLSRIGTVKTETRNELSRGTRLAIDRDTIRMSRQRPLLGWGLGTFRDVYPQFRSFYSDLVVNEAHNDYLQFLAETGICGSLIILWFLGIVCRNSLWKIRYWPANINGAVGLAALISMTGILVHSFVDFNLQVPANALMSYAICTMAALDARFSAPRQKVTT